MPLSRTDPDIHSGFRIVAVMSVPVVLSMLVIFPAASMARENAAVVVSKAKTLIRRRMCFICLLVS